MSKLQRKIKTLEASMNHDSRRMHDSLQILSNFTHSLPFIVIGGTATFMVGVMLGYKRNYLQFSRVLTRFSFKANKLRNLVGLLFSIFP